MKNTIKVTIVGCSGTGKSALAHGIRSLCAEYGVGCSIGGVEDDTPGVVEASWRDRLQAIGNKGHKVEITTIQANRSGL